MTCCKKCGTDTDELMKLVNKLRRNIVHLDMLLWDMQLAEWRG